MGRQEEEKRGGKTSNLSSHLNELIRNNSDAGESRTIEETGIAKVCCFENIY